MHRPGRTESSFFSRREHNKRSFPEHASVHVRARTQAVADRSRAVRGVHEEFIGGLSRRSVRAAERWLTLYWHDRREAARTCTSARPPRRRMAEASARTPRVSRGERAERRRHFFGGRGLFMGSTGAHACGWLSVDPAPRRSWPLPTSSWEDHLRVGQRE